MAKDRHFDGVAYHSAGWYPRKTDAQKAAKWHRSRGFSARIMRARNPGAGNRFGFEVFIRGMAMARKAG